MVVFRLSSGLRGLDKEGDGTPASKRLDEDFKNNRRAGKIGIRCAER
jgi:hypothetical protein